MNKEYYIDSVGEVRQIKPSFYKAWQESEGIPVFEEYYVDDVNKLLLGDWKRKGCRGCFINLVGSMGMNDFYFCEIPAGESTKPQKHLFEEQIYILQGRGATTVWHEQGPKQTFEWQEGSLFSPPLNIWHQHYNGRGDMPVRYIAMTLAPTILNLFQDSKFIFTNDYVFTQRYGSEDDYFSAKATLMGRDDAYAVWKSVEDYVSGKEPSRSNTLKTNFVPDVRQVKLEEMRAGGEGFSIRRLRLSNNASMCHIAEFEVGTYKVAHRHPGGAHIIILDGKGYTLMWLEGKEKERMRINWQKGTIIVPPEGWLHQHFPTSKTPTRYLALRGNIGLGAKHYKTTVSISRGGDCVPYAQEDREIRKMYVEELSKEGIECRMKGP